MDAGERLVVVEEAFRNCRGWWSWEIRKNWFGIEGVFDALLQVLRDRRSRPSDRLSLVIDYAIACAGDERRFADLGYCFGEFGRQHGKFVGAFVLKGFFVVERGGFGEAEFGRFCDLPIDFVAGAVEAEDDRQAARVMQIENDWSDWRIDD